MSEERRRRLLSPKALGTAWREKRRRGGGPAMHDQVEERGGGAQTRGEGKQWGIGAGNGTEATGTTSGRTTQ
jgi:hypothetical protein